MASCGNQFLGCCCSGLFLLRSYSRCRLPVFLSLTVFIVSFALLALVSKPVFAEVRIAMAGKNDLERNGEYVWVNAFANHLNDHGFETLIYPSNILGREQERLDQTALGLIHVNLGIYATAAKIEPLTRGLALPFLFDDVDHFYRLINNTQLVDDINQSLNLFGVQVVAFPMRGGGSGLFNTTHSIKTLADIRRLRLRAADRTQLKFLQALGSKATVVGWAEVANALQTNIAQGYINPPASALLFGHTDLLSYYTPLNVNFPFRIVSLSQDWFQSLNQYQQQIIKDAIKRANIANRQWLENWTLQAEQLLLKEGIVIDHISTEEREQFKRLAKGMWTEVMDDSEIQSLKQALTAAENSTGKGL